MQKDLLLLKSLGELVKSTRCKTMDQHELGLRVGVGRNSISAIENGKAVSAATLFKVLAQLNLIDDFQLLVDDKLDDVAHTLNRKSRTYKELDNDF